MNLIKKQIAFSSKVNPEGEIKPAWENFLQYTVNRESYIDWAQREEPRALRDDILEYDAKPWYSKLNFIIP